MVPGAEQLPLPGIPNGESKIAQQPIGAALAPALVSPQDQFRIAIIARREAPGLEPMPQFRTVVHAAVQRKAKRGIPVRKGLLLMRRFRSALKHQMAESDRAIDPVPDSVRSPVLDRRRHSPQQEVVGGPTIEVVEASDSAHQVIILVLAE